MKTKYKAFIGSLTIVLIAQIIPVNREAPTDAGIVPAPPEVRAILKRSCDDCHSNRTVWPWYGYVAPMSWLVASHVHEGREHLNFTTWGAYRPEVQTHKLEEVWEEVEHGEMPLWLYTLAHPQAQLSEDEKKLLRQWVTAMTTAPRPRETLQTQ